MADLLLAKAYLRRVLADSGGPRLDCQRSVEQSDYRFERLTREIIGVFFETFNELGHGFREDVYEAAMVVSLTESGLTVRRSAALPVWFHGHQIAFFRADAIVDNVVLLEFKAAAAIEPWHVAQVLNYLRASDVEIALLLNFGPKPQFKRLAFSNSRKKGFQPATPRSRRDQS